MQELCENVWDVGHPLFNVYLVAGERRTALVEAGISAVAHRVIGALGRLGVDPDLIVLTHPHTDHASGLRALGERFPGARVMAAPGAGEFLAHPRVAQGFAAEDRFMAEALGGRGEEVGREPEAAPPDLRDALVVGEGARVDLGGLTLEFREAGGHAPGNLLVRVPERGVVFASDSLGFRYGDGAFMPLFFTGYAPYLETLARIRDLAPEIVALGHQGALRGEEAARAVEAAGRAARDLRERVGAYRGSDEALAAELFDEVYRDELTFYSPGNIRACCSLLVRRVREAG